MKNSAHTTGPWVSDAPPDDICVDIEAPAYSATAIGPAGRFPVALVVTLGWDDAKHEANVRLVEAAPDMLAALENLENDDGKCMPSTAWDLVHAAIAKAKGERS